ncbi:MAG: iron ABC transporter permease [Proteobacteria bacterium]|nr:iron ABC transporter permease [Pseudomonadota bacterium]MDA0959330.1 iron ABC transporter permease [Pseudomonadota bacterium]MDA1151346.1 iron ABC transporter permease [Pseudomonadota bacterium]
MLLDQAKLGSIVVILLAIGSYASLQIGHVEIDFFSAISSPLYGISSPDSIILWDLRMPRTLMCLIVGFGLGIAGACLQGFLRNPLAEPSVVGISSAAALGAVFSIGLGFSALGFYYTPAFSLSFAAIASWALLKLTNNASNKHSVILIGIGISSLSGAFTTLILSLSENPFAINEIVFWMLGSVTDVSYSHVIMSTPLVILGSLFLLRNANSLNLMTLGEETAASTGVNIPKLRRDTLIGTALTVGSITSVVGIVGFVGLVTPHIVRPFVKHEPGKTLIWTPPIAALLVLLSDISIRLLPTASEIKLGVLTALLGTPFFLYLVSKQRG